MKAREMLETYLKEPSRGFVVASGYKGGRWFWWHIHLDEELPEGYDITIRIIKEKGE